MSWDVWWLWIAGALVLLIVEVIAPAYIALGFAVGAFCVGLLLVFTSLSSLPLALVVFSFASLLAWYCIRQLLGDRKGQVKTWETDIND